MAAFPQKPAVNRTVFLIGKPLGHSLSPVMQNAAFRALGMRTYYAPLELEPGQLPGFFTAFKSVNVVGANVTVPYKEKVLGRLDRVEKDAAWLGSVNTLYKKQGAVWGASTDGEGFLLSLGRRRAALRGSSGVLLGAGGAARSVAGALAGSGVKRLMIANRSPDRARRLGRALIRRFPRMEVGMVSIAEAEKLLPRMDWVVQATSLGLEPGDPSPMSLRGAGNSLWVADLVYHRTTAFLSQARRRRLWALGGVGMLLHQGALAFEKWTGQRAPLSVMRSALLAGLR
ncbi:MAG TPA: shikimate dehydrogenase, partial [bacterium]|nr:shikimate dehydrogenase [bacterium]